MWGEGGGRWARERRADTGDETPQAAAGAAAASRAMGSPCPAAPAVLPLRPCSLSGAWPATAPLWACSSTRVGRAALSPSRSAAQLLHSEARLAAPAPHCRLRQPISKQSSMRRLCGARLPAGLQSDPARVQELRQFIQYAAGLPDVWFVTNQQVGEGSAIPPSWHGVQAPAGSSHQPIVERQADERTLPAAQRWHRAGVAAADRRTLGRQTGGQISTKPSSPLPLHPQVLAWMQSPVPASRVDRQLKCEAPTDISPDVGTVCATYVG